MKLQIGAVYYAHFRTEWCLWLCQSEDEVVVIDSHNKSNIGVVYIKTEQPYIKTWEWRQNRLLKILYTENA